MRLQRAALAIFLLVPSFLLAQDVTFTINAAQDGPAIPESVYGANDLGISGATVHRHGGNRHTGLNWENNASNAGSDYIHHSDSWLGGNAGIGNSQVPGALLQAWVNADRAQGLKTIITLPLAGYVAADMNGTVTVEQTAPGIRWKQIVADKPGALSLNPDAADGAVYLEEMVNFLVHHYGNAANDGVVGYSLDNEPALWSETHPRIHPAKVTYQELINRHVPVATVTTALDPSAKIYGPVGYGWNEHLSLQDAPDAAQHNATYGSFTNYYLAQMKNASDAAGRRLLHYYDLHWYPEARGDNRIVFGSSPGTNNDIDARLQAPRSLWDPTYFETSWITQWTTNGQGIRLLPRLQEAVDQHYPGTGLAITEYNYGASDHISGGVAVADVLGIFGRYQVAACYWPLQSNNSYVAGAFQLYRNYDGAGGKFGTISLAATASDNAKAAVHAARTSAGKLTIVAINRSRTLSRTAALQITLGTGQTLSELRAFRLTAAGAQVQTVANPPAPTGANFSDTLPAMSASLYELQINPSGFAAWQQQQFGAGSSDPAIAGPTVDPDRDGLPNLTEYVTRRDPNSPETTAPLRLDVIQNGGSKSLRLQFERRKGVTDAQLALESCVIMAPANWAEMDLEVLNPTITDIAAETEQVTVVFPAPANAGFYRLSATH